jgi:hypothetical protein
MLRSAFTRVACYLAFWIVIAGTGTVDLIVGALAAIIATWVSLHLLPPASRRVSFAAMCTFVPRFLYQSIVAGVDVALGDLLGQLVRSALAGGQPALQSLADRSRRPFNLPAGYRPAEHAAQQQAEQAVQAALTDKRMTAAKSASPRSPVRVFRR